MRVLKLSTSLVSGIAVSLTLFLGQPVAQDNPDLLDDFFAATDALDPNDTASVSIFGASSFAFLKGYAKNFQAAGPSSSFLQFRLYEPDKVTRKLTSGQLKQSSQLFMRTGLHNATSAVYYASGLAPCKMVIKEQDTDANGFADVLKWKAKCTDPAAAMTAIGMTAPQQAQFLAVYGPDLVVQGKGP